MPVFHIGGVRLGACSRLYHGAKRRDRARIRSERRCSISSAHYGISKLFLVPAAMQFIVRQPRAREMDFSQPQIHACMARRRSPPHCFKECIAVFGCGFVQMYGMTETTGTIVVLAPEDHVEGPRAACAPPARRCPASRSPFIDPDLADPLPTGGRSARSRHASASNMVGYWNLPDATARTLDKRQLAAHRRCRLSSTRTVSSTSTTASRT